MSDSEDKEQRDGAVTAAPKDQPASGEDSSLEGCPVKMYFHNHCGRPIHSAPSHDATPVCLMHSRDPEKSNAAFQEEFEAILKAAGKRFADFTEFVFPDANHRRREFAASCIFQRAVFLQHVDFGSGTTFAQDANFIKTTFAQQADFSNVGFAGSANFSSTNFMQFADFTGAKFTRNANFNAVTFMQDARFSAARFTEDAYFILTKFKGRTDFMRGTFTQAAKFVSAAFTQGTNFEDATFTQGVDFGSVMFGEAANFRNAKFAQIANFFKATFTLSALFSKAAFRKDADFREATFTAPAEFNEATFTQNVNFVGAKFLGPVEFRDTKFRGHDKDRKERRQESLPGPVFSLAEFSQPEKMIFYKTYLGQALFHNCDVSQVTFSSVVWREREGKRMVFEEEVDLASAFAEALRPAEGNPDERNYGLIAELYQQLKKNYDERKDYWTAGDFHYGELEMKRLSSRRRNRVLRQFVQHLRLVALYRLASEYGESYVRPALWLGIVLLVSALVFPVIGLRYDSAKNRGGSAATMAPDIVLTYANPLFPGQPATDRRKAQWRLFGNSCVTAVEIAAFQKEPAYQPVYPWGRVLTLVETLLTSTLAALFFLAVRRQFRR